MKRKHESQNEQKRVKKQVKLSFQESKKENTDTNLFKWLLPFEEQNLTPIEKQYNEWCENVCDRFAQNWTMLRNEIHRFHTLGFRHGWKRILMDLLDRLISRDVVGVIAGYLEENPWLEMYKTGVRGSWQEACQAMFWLWCPAFTRPEKPIKMGHTLDRIHFSYTIRWTCQHPDCNCQYDPKPNRDENKSCSIHVYWNECNQRYTSCDFFHKRELDGLLLDLQCKGRNRTAWSFSDCWSYTMEQAHKIHIRDQALPALFLLYFYEK